MISLFDRERQHIVAEALQDSPLAAKSAPLTREASDDNFWLCGTAIPRSFGICEHVLVVDPSAATADELPVSVVPDLAEDPRFQDRPYIHGHPFNHFYAGVPIRTPGPNGINIGVYCIFDPQPRPQGLGADEIKFLRDISRTVMNYLECRVSHGRCQRSERMVRGMGNFVEGADSLVSTGGSAPGRPSGHSKKRISRQVDPAEVLPAGAKSSSSLPLRPRRPEPLSKTLGTAGRKTDDSLLSPRTASFVSSPTQKAFPVSIASPEIATLRQFAPLAPDDSSRSSTPRPESQQSGDSSPRPGVLSQVSTVDLQLVETRRVFAKAANIIRQSLDVDGVLFLDATVRSFGGLVGQTERKSSAIGLDNGHYLSNDEEAIASQTPSVASREDLCKVLGFSTAQGSSIRDDRTPWHFEGLRDRTLHRMLRKYPNGRIFNFEADGQVLQPPPGVAERDPPTPRVFVAPQRPVSPARQWSNESLGPQELRLDVATTSDPGGQIPIIQKQRSSVGESIITLFPGARSVITLPLWDAQKKRWVSGGFIWSNNPKRVFTTDETLNFLRVFGLVIMAEIHRLNTKAEETIKSNILGSISHELRSPLHGLVGAVELLHDSKLDAVQHNVLNIIETSGKTLVDTINHLLDYSKINNHLDSDPKKESVLGKVGVEPNDRRNAANVLPVELDCLVEEVVESVLAGFHHERMSMSPRSMRDVAEYRKMSDELAAAPLAPERVQIYLDIEATRSWSFYTHPGAFRRIVMNLFGNALKFTRSGFVRISLTKQPAKPYEPNARATVLLTVADSGKGISENYLQHHLFTPFCQEDSFAPGTGLGLSLVRQIAVNLGGEVKVVSQVGRGTTITVSLPLLNDADDDAEAASTIATDSSGSRTEIERLRGRKVLLRGFDGADSHVDRLTSQSNEDVGRLSGSRGHFVERTCRAWLHMQVLSELEAEMQRPDFIIQYDSMLSFEDGEKIAAEAPCPVLFICDASVAQRNFSCSLPNAETRIRTFEFFSPPLGPRKLAKGLVHLMDMSKVKQEQQEPVTSVEVLSIETDVQRATIDEKGGLIPAYEMTTELTKRVTAMKTTSKTNIDPETHPLKLAGSSSLPTPPEDPRSKDPMARATLVHVMEGIPAEKTPVVMIVDDNAINLKVSKSQSSLYPQESAC